jgi:hypothetical protein
MYAIPSVAVIRKVIFGAPFFAFRVFAVKSLIEFIGDGGAPLSCALLRALNTAITLKKAINPAAIDRTCPDPL